MWRRLAALVLALALIGLPGVGRADDNDNADHPVTNQGVSGSGGTGGAGTDGDKKNQGVMRADDKKAPDLKVGYVGWDANVPELIHFKVTNVGDAPSAATTGHGETITPPPSQETAPPIPALAPGASFDIRYAVYPAEACADHRVKMSVPLVNDKNPKDNTVEVQLCKKGEGPDLKLEYLGIDPGNSQLINFRVTNVGAARSAATTGRVETIAPPPAQETAPPIPALAPGGTYQFPYALFGTTGCDDHTVKASVPLAGDSYPINNTKQIQVCQPKPPPPEPDPIVVGPAPIVVVPEYKRPGEHTLVLPEPPAKPFALGIGDGIVTGDGECRRPGYYETSLAVGWEQVEVTHDVLFVEVDDCNAWYESQVGVEFDFGIFDEIPDPRVTRAVLYYDERELNWTDGDGHRQAKGTCVAHVDIATENWHLVSSSSFPLASEGYRDIDPKQPGRVDVTSATFQQILKQRPRHGFILRGSLGLNQLEGQSDESCVSSLSNLQLEVTYVVP